MANINRDLDRYLRQRGSSTPGYTGPGWFDKMFAQAEQEEQTRLTSSEKEKLETMEHEIEHGEEQLEVVQNLEEDLEEKQEQRVGIYHHVMRMFQRKQPEEPIEDVELPVNDDSEDDFRRLAEIQVRWFSRLPHRAREEFKDSDDFHDLLEIYERRGVARKK